MRARLVPTSRGFRVPIPYDQEGLTGIRYSRWGSVGLSWSPCRCREPDRVTILVRSACCPPLCYPLCAAYDQGIWAGIDEEMGYDLCSMLMLMPDQSVSSGRSFSPFSRQHALINNVQHAALSSPLALGSERILHEIKIAN